MGCGFEIRTRKGITEFFIPDRGCTDFTYHNPCSNIRNCGCIG